MNWQTLLVKEFRFHPVRRWRFDYAIPEALVAIEVEGGIYAGGRHVRGAGYEKDCQKYNEAQLLGWIVLRYPSWKKIVCTDVDRAIIRQMQRGACNVPGRPLVYKKD